MNKEITTNKKLNKKCCFCSLNINNTDDLFIFDNHDVCEFCFTNFIEKKKPFLVEASHSCFLKFYQSHNLNYIYKPELPIFYIHRSNKIKNVYKISQSKELNNFSLLYKLLPETELAKIEYYKYKINSLKLELKNKNSKINSLLSDINTLTLQINTLKKQKK